MSKVKATYVEVYPVYDRCMTEEGPSTYVSGYSLHAAVHDDSKNCLHYVHHHKFFSESEASVLLEQVEAADRMINPEHWSFVSVDHYRTAEEMEYDDMQLAYRERMGLPL